MGFPVGYTEVLLPKLFLHALWLLGLVRSFVSVVFRLVGLSEFLESDLVWRDSQVRMPPVLMREMLPVVKLESVADPPETCAVCLHELDGGDDIRWLSNCRHIFHRACLDRWMDHDQNTCPLCRTSFVPHQMQHHFNQRLWDAATGLHDFEMEL